jgi:hypothetical protein
VALITPPPPGILPALATQMLSFTLQVTVPGMVAVSALLASEQPDPDTSNNQATLNVLIPRIVRRIYLPYLTSKYEISDLYSFLRH